MTQTTAWRSDLDDAAAGVPLYDLAFVGAGASTSYVLLALLGALTATPPARALRVAVVERARDPFAGLAYGSRAGRTALLITPLRDFLPDGERRLFTDWLAANKDWAFDEYLAAEGPVSARWWQRHRDAVARDDFEDLFLPRHVFGTYLALRVQAAVDQAVAAGVATVEVVRDEVVAIDAGSSVHRLSCRGGTVLARHTVLATGSSTIQPRLSGTAPTAGAVLVDDPYDGMDEVAGRIRKSLERMGPDEPAPHVVLLGGNAGTMDMLYQVADLEIVAARGAVVTVLSPRGELPERMERAREDVPFTAECLLALTGAATVRAAQVFEAALADLERGRRAGYSVADTLAPISEGVMAVLPRLSAEETLEYAGYWGVELGRHQRRAGWEYWEVVEELSAAARFSMVAGSFTGLEGTEGRGVRVVYEHGGVRTELDRPADVVINCAGPARHLRDTDPSLVATLIEEGVVRPTASGGGIQVQPSLEAAPGLHVMGPLLAGNLVHGRPVWHMEHCGRISAFGTALGTQLAESLTADVRTPTV